ncbi:hypothetical protein CRUP_038700 [Coryphaenoides rupestris]|nr:hypothetical protein CRUP_038700 [Coryphaenoides rupestris]
MAAYSFTITASFPLNSSGQDGRAPATPNPGVLCPTDGSSGNLRIVLTLFYSLFFVLGLAGNLLALWVFLRSRSKKNSVHVLLINVALADLLLVACLPFRVWYHGVGRDHWELGATMCHVVGNFFYMNMYMSITLLGLISVDRYLKISRGGTAAMQSGWRSKRLPLLPAGLAACGWSTLACAFIWVLALGLSLLFIFSKQVRDEEEHERCFQYKQLRNAMWKGYVNLMLVLLFWVTYGAMVASYVKIAHKLLRMSREKPDLPNALRYARTAKKSFFILFLFTVCFVPYHVVRVFYVVTQITDSSCYWRGVADQANEVVLLLSALNSCLDPIMYFLLSSSVRKQVMQLLHGASGNSSSVEQGSGTGRSTPRL